MIFSVLCKFFLVAPSLFVSLFSLSDYRDVNSKILQKTAESYTRACGELTGRCCKRFVCFRCRSHFLVFVRKLFRDERVRVRTINQDENIRFILKVRKFVRFIIFAKRGVCVIPSAQFFMTEDNFKET
jgi:hypothetical protein